MNKINQSDFPMSKDGGCIPLPASNEKLAQIALEIGTASKKLSESVLKNLMNNKSKN